MRDEGPGIRGQGSAMRDMGPIGRMDVRMKYGRWLACCSLLSHISDLSSFFSHP